MLVSRVLAGLSGSGGGGALGEARPGIDIAIKRSVLRPLHFTALYLPSPLPYFTLCTTPYPPSPRPTSRHLPLPSLCPFLPSLTFSYSLLSPIFPFLSSTFSFLSLPSLFFYHWSFSFRLYRGLYFLIFYFSIFTFIILFLNGFLARAFFSALCWLLVMLILQCVDYVVNVLEVVAEIQK